MECRRDCPIAAGGVCPRHGIKKTAHWVLLCRTRDAYFRAWEERRGPGQHKLPTESGIVDRPAKSPSAWMTCDHRREALAEVPARTAGCGCSTATVHFYRCGLFEEPVLKQCTSGAWRRNGDKLRAACPGYAGRICSECQVP